MPGNLGNCAAHEPELDEFLFEALFSFAVETRVLDHEINHFVRRIHLKFLVQLFECIKIVLRPRTGVPEQQS